MLNKNPRVAPDPIFDNLPKRKVSWVSWLLNKLGTLIVASPQSMKHKPDFWMLPTDRTPAGSNGDPNDHDVAALRTNVFTDYCHRAMASSLTPWASGGILVCTVGLLIVNLSLATVAQKWSAASAKRAQAEYTETLEGFGQANLATCEKVLDDANDLAEKKKGKGYKMDDEDRALSDFVGRCASFYTYEPSTNTNTLKRDLGTPSAASCSKMVGELNDFADARKSMLTGGGTLLTTAQSELDGFGQNCVNRKFLDYSYQTYRYTLKGGNDSVTIPAL